MGSQQGELTTGLLPRTEETRAWRIRVDGRPIEEINGGKPVKTLEIVAARDPKNPDATLLGRLDYGAEPKPDGSASGYDTWVWKERGGSVTLPFALLKDKDDKDVLYVATVEQRRFCETHPEYNASGKVRNAPRGFHKVGSTAAKTAEEERLEEVGVFKGETFRLKGENSTANNSWFAYDDEVDTEGRPVRQGGATSFAVEVKPEMLEEISDDRFRIKPSMLGERPKGSPYEMIGNCVFERWERAIQYRDSFTPVATVRLIAHLKNAGRISVSI